MMNYEYISFAGPHSPFPQSKSQKDLVLTLVRTASFGHLSVVLSVDVSTIHKTVKSVTVALHCAKQFFPCRFTFFLPFYFICPPEEGQRICVSVFPIIKIWLQQISLPRTEIFQPVCSFVAMTVSNNCKYKKQQSKLNWDSQYSTPNLWILF